jgi:hypothetical protein
MPKKRPEGPPEEYTIKGLKTVLVAVGALCVLSCMPGVFVPWSAIVRLLGFLGYSARPVHPLIPYCLRLTSLGYGLMGVLFLVLASDPLRYRPMLVLAVCGLFLLGLLALGAGWLVQLRPPWYLADAASCLVGAVLILAFWPKQSA